MIKSVFDRRYRRYDAWYDRNRFAYLSELKAIRKVLPKKGIGLEIGVGTGRFAQALGIKYGIDPSGNMMRLARKRGVTVRRGYGENLPYDDKSFDYAALIITICFVRDPARVLKDAYRVLRKRGKMIIGFVDSDSFLGKYYRGKKSPFYKGAVFFNTDKIIRLLRRSGFIKFACYQTLYDIPSAIEHVQKPIKGSGRGGFVVVRAERP